MKSSKKDSLLFFVLLLFGPQVQSSVNAGLLKSSTIPQHLSEFGFFQNMQKQIPAKDVHPYSLVSPLFSDYTDKLRFVYVPENQKLGYIKDKVFIFPVGSTLINFCLFKYKWFNG